MIPRAVEFILPYLRDLFPNYYFGTWIENPNFRNFPHINFKRVGGTRLYRRSKALSHQSIEMLVITQDDPATTERIYEDCLDALYNAVERQTVLPGGEYLYSILETTGAHFVDSPFDDTWAMQGVIRFGMRPRKQDRSNPY